MIPLMKNAFIKEDMTRQALAAFLAGTGQLSMGPKCSEFEAQFAAMQGRRFAHLFNSGASANLALIQALKNLGRLVQGSRVGFSSLTWATNTMPIIQMGMTPVPVDCSPATLNVMSADLRTRLDAVRLDALFITNALGFAGDLHRIAEVCRSEGMILLEDNCEALGTELSGTKTGNFGLASTFSFFVAHHMSTVEGGMICTDDPELSEMLVIVRANGWDRNLPADSRAAWRRRHGGISDFDAKYTFYDLAFNLRPTEITGFLGLEQLKYLDEAISIREKNYVAIESVSASNSDIMKLEHGHISRLSSFAIPVICVTAGKRDAYRKAFEAEGIEVRPIIAGNIQSQPFYRKYVQETYPLPGTETISRNGFYCGNYPELDEKDLETIGRCIEAPQAGRKK
jgi:CDP-6-deoxy-D-xylo-4-hexulose-3-dehydrase